MAPRLPRIMDEMRQDIVYAIRTTVRRAGFLVAALSLGLSFGATVSVYTTAEWLLARSPGGVVEPERLVAMSLTEAGRPDLVGRFGFSFPQYEALREVQDAFTDVAAYSKVQRFASTDGWAGQLVFQFVTGSYFPLLGVQPYLGRLIGPDDDLDGAAALGVLSHAFWKSHFGGDPEVVGRTMLFDDDPITIIGVLPSDYEDYSIDWNGPTHVWLPMRSAQSLQGMPGMLTVRSTFFPILGRLRPGITEGHAREMAQRWVPQLPSIVIGSFVPNAIGVRPEHTERIARRDAAQAFLGPLLVVCFLVFLAACANVANFLLGRAAERRREMALRAAVGASRARVFRQVAAESALLALVTAGIATAAGAWMAFLLAPLPNVYLGLSTRADPVSTAGAIDTRMVALALSCGFLVTLALGLLPTLRAFHDPVAVIRRARAGWGWSRLRPSLRQSVLVLQVGLGVVLTVSAALLARSFQRAAHTDSELADPETLLFVSVVPRGLEPREREALYRALQTEVEQAPGVVSASLSGHPPWAGGIGGVEPPTDPGGRVEVGGAVAGPGHFETSGMEIVAGAPWTDFVERGPAIINERLAEMLWPGEDPLGRTFVLSDQDVHVVAVVRRERCRTLLGPPSPCVWTPVRLESTGMTIRIRTTGPARDFLPALRQTVERLSPSTVIVREQSLTELVSRSTRAERVAAVMSAALAVFGIVLVAAGFVSVFLRMVHDSRGELAIRIALGATGRRLTARVTAQATLLLGLGIVLGLSAATVVAERLGGRLVGVSPTDPLSYAFAAAVAVTVGLGSAAFAARAAVGTAPCETLRAEG